MNILDAVFGIDKAPLFVDEILEIATHSSPKTYGRPAFIVIDACRTRKNIQMI